MRSDKLFFQKYLLFSIKCTPSRKEHKTSFSILTTTELNLPAEFTKSCKWQAPYISFKETMIHKLRAKSHELKALSYELRYKLHATSYELQITSFEKQVTSFKRRYVTCKIQPAPADDSTVWYLDLSMIVRCRIVPYIDRIQLSQLICTGWWLYGTGVVPQDHQLVEARF
jgi:hypothetical protein